MCEQEKIPRLLNTLERKVHDACENDDTALLNEAVSEAISSAPRNHDIFHNCARRIAIKKSFTAVLSRLVVCDVRVETMADAPTHLTCGIVFMTRA
jgi:hypothetical protein